ncbi:MAG: type II toxin-antitoxin system RelE/ParE family toxin [Patescibacteria group bacterium]|nr:type II toxin-antitoxin system RelE/ParE family toxin [Patescibacteria group bacterium]
MELVVKTSPKFKRKFKKIAKKDPKLAKKIDKRLSQLINNPGNPLLKVHKLDGHKESTWSFSVSYIIRVIFIFGDKELLIMDIGNHDDVY